MKDTKAFLKDTERLVRDIDRHFDRAVSHAKKASQMTTRADGRFVSEMRALHETVKELAALLDKGIAVPAEFAGSASVLAAITTFRLRSIGDALVGVERACRPERDATRLRSVAACDMIAHDLLNGRSRFKSFATLGLKALERATSGT